MEPNTSTTNIEFHTTDIVLAAYLRVNGYALNSILKTGNKGTFVFHDVDPALVCEYDWGNAQVEPVAFNNTIKQLTTSVRRMD